MSRSHRIDVSLLLTEGGEARRLRLDRLRARLRREPGLTNAHLIAPGEEGAGAPAGADLLCIHYDPAAVSLRHVVETARRLGAEVEDHFGVALLATRFRTPQEAGYIEDLAALQPGVLAASASFAARRLRLEYDTRRTTLEEVLRGLRAAGARGVGRADVHAATAEERERTARHARIGGLDWRDLARSLRDHDDLARSLLCGLLLVGGLAVEWLAGPVWAFPILLGALVVGGRETTSDVAKSLAIGRLDIDLLMLVAALGAAALSHTAEGALLMFLFSLGHALEHLALERARGAIEGLKELAPETALRLLADGGTEEVPSAALAPGDVILVRPGDRIAADGRVESGASAVDQSPITGESMPVDKEAGAEVFAGTINGDGALRVKVERPSSDNTLARVVRLVEAAQAEKSRTEVLTERVNRYYVPAVIGATVCAWVGPPLLWGASWTEWFYRSMALVTGAAPCALAIGTPAAILSGMARAARSGILVKGGAHLETLGHIRAIAFDKTGTLTAGRPRVAEVIACGTLPEHEVLRLLGGLETASGHPLAAAIVAEARRRGLALPDPQGVEQVKGMGLRAQLEGARLEAGNARMFEAVPAALAARVEALESAGRTIVLLRRDSEFVGLVGLSDAVRPQARAVIAVLRTMGIEHVALLTGDQERSAQAVASAVGVDEVGARLLPEDKVERVAGLVRRFGTVGMVGDGVNDAPALAAASIGIAMGTAGSDVALESADVALMGDDLALLPEAVRLSRRTRRLMIQNLVIALGTIAALVPAALLGWVPIGWAVLFHEGSTVVVVLNALRLLR